MARQTWTQRVHRHRAGRAAFGQGRATLEGFAGWLWFQSFSERTVEKYHGRAVYVSKRLHDQGLSLLSSPAEMLSALPADKSASYFNFTVRAQRVERTAAARFKARSM
jgi:hypothetical protein